MINNERMNHPNMKTKTLPTYKSKEYVNLRELIEDVAVRFPNRNAFSYRKKPSDETAVRVPFPVFRDDIRALGTELLARGMHGRHCALIGKLTYPWVCAYVALISIGAVVVPLDKDWQEEELAKTVSHADCTFLICDDSAKNEAVASKSGIHVPLYLGASKKGDSIETLIRRGKDKLDAGDRSYFEAVIRPLSMSILVFTSGTTGSGKGVMLSQTGLMADLYAGLSVVKLSRKTIAVLPPHHTYGCNVGLVAHIAAGCEVYLSDGLRHILKEMREEHPEHLTLVPLFIETFYRRLLSTAKDQGKDKLLFRMMKASNAMRRVGLDVRRSVFQSVLATFGGKLKLMISGGAPISQEILDTFDAIGITVINGYGITECTPLISVTHQEAPIPNSVGKPLFCNKVKLRHPNTDGEGEICVRGANVMIGYYKNDDATEEAFDEDGYFRTGDYGKFDRNGNLYITGRLKNLIILSNGKNVYPEEIESEISAVPGVLEIVVYEGQSRRGVEHNAIVAEIYPDLEYLKKLGVSDPTAYFQKAVDDYNRTALSYKKIAHLKIREDEFPKNTLRKILRYRLDTKMD